MRDLKIFFFIKRGKKNKEGLTAIYGKITYLDSSTTYSTGVAIKPADWDKTKQLSKAKTKEEEDLQGTLNEQKEKLRKAKDQMLLLGRSVTAEILKEVLFPDKKKKQVEDNLPKKPMLREVLKEFISEKQALVAKKRRSEGTLTKYNTVSRHLEHFLKTQMNLNDIALDELKFKFVNDFYHYLINDRIINNIKDEGICNNTSQKYIQALRSCIFYAIKMDYLLGDPFKRWVYEWDDVETVYLTKSELAQIENYQFKNKRLDVVRDIFLFTCYTGFAPCDLKHISWDNLELRDNGKHWFNVLRQKTGIKCEVMMFSKTRALIDKYKDDPFCKQNNLLMPFRANQTMNEYLKEVAHHCGIVKPLYHYVGRHTFATTTMLSNGASLEVTKRALGHRRINQTEHYAKIVDSKIRTEMERVDENLSDKENEKADVKIIPMSELTDKLEENEAHNTRKKLRTKKTG